MKTKFSVALVAAFLLMTATHKANAQAQQLNWLTTGNTVTMLYRQNTSLF